MQSQLTYSLPVRKEDFIHAISDPRVHTGKVLHTVDFDVPVGTPVLASQKGVVVGVYTESNEGGFEEKYLKDFEKYTNVISVKHADNEFTQYAHLAHKSEKVSVGQQVACGDALALSGNTGYSSEPHVHFHVVRLLDDGKDWESLEIQWNTIFPILRYV